MNTLILGYVTFYGTNQLMLSPLVVGIVLMASRITDGVTDLFAGFHCRPHQDQAREGKTL